MTAAAGLTQTEILPAASVLVTTSATGTRLSCSDPPARPRYGMIQEEALSDAVTPLLERPASSAEAIPLPQGGGNAPDYVYAIGRVIPRFPRAGHG